MHNVSLVCFCYPYAYEQLTYGFTFTKIGRKNNSISSYLSTFLINYMCTYMYIYSHTLWQTELTDTNKFVSEIT